jgi:integrase
MALLSHCLSDSEERRLIAAVSDKNRLALEFALLTGIRRNTQATIRWRDIDFERSEICIEDAKKSRRRLLRVPFDLLDRLRAANAKYQSDELIFPQCDESQLVWWYRALESANLKHIHWHDLRYTCLVRLHNKKASDPSATFGLAR